MDDLLIQVVLHHERNTANYAVFSARDKDAAIPFPLHVAKAEWRAQGEPELIRLTIEAL